MAQIAADALEVPFEQVTLYHGSTTYLPEGYGSYGSRATVMGGERNSADRGGDAG
jgi:aerobic carbon-monoxide dehydrogenase large subunit